jgi:protein O-GlcNAc transferase
MKWPLFLEQLTALYEEWGRPSVRPKSDRFAQVLARVRGMTSPGVLQLLNFAVACLEGDEAYCEVGCFQGATLVGALLGHPGRRAYAADNFAQFDPHRRNRAVLLHNLAAFGLLGQVRFHDQDGEDFLLGLRGGGARVGVYLYDGAHDYRSQLLGLLLAVPLLAERALLVVDDGNWPAVRQAAFDFLAARPEGRLLLDLPTPGNCHPTFWNGVLVLGWDAHGRNGHDGAALRRGRQPALLESLSALQWVDLRVEGNTVRMTPRAEGAP